MNMAYAAALVILSMVLISCAHNERDDAAISAEGIDKAAAYRSRLDQDPYDTRARLKYATVLSWQGQYRAAERQYSTLLEQQPENLEAMTGLAYNYVWSKQFGLAEQQFKTALDHVPGDFGVQKGLAMTYLQSGRCSQALETLEPLRLQHPEDLEILAALESARMGVIENASNVKHE